MNRKLTLILLGLIVALGAYFRLAHLGLPAFRGDSLEFWRICNQNLAPSQIFKDWMNLMGLSGQFPFSVAWTKWFLLVFGMQVDHFTLRLPSALVGIATVAAAYLTGRSVAGPRSGLFLALLMAVNPFHIQMSREAYFYPPLVLGACFSLYAAMESIAGLRAEQSAQRRAGTIAAAWAGFFLMTFSQPTGWMIALLCALCVVGCEVVHFRRDKKIRPSTVVLGVGFLVIGIPLLTAPWGLTQLRQISQGALKEHAVKAAAVSGENLSTMVMRVVASFSWGETWPRFALAVLLLAATVFYLWKHGRSRPELFAPPVLMVVGFVAFIFMREQAGAMFEARYVSGLIPVYLAILTIGALGAAELLAKARPGSEAASETAVVGAMAAVCIYPAILCTQLTGQPTPYKDIVAWTDSNLPKGTPVIVDRWFEPWNELKLYPSTNVTFTFTIPNEPLETFLSTRWRDTATNFFEKFPEAAYLELAKQYFQVPGVGNWEWPRKHFARHVGITNVAGLKLRNLGLANRGDFYWATTNRVIIDIFYNTRQDNIDRWKAQGVQQKVLFGRGWEFTKTQDYRDWRILADKAEVEILNLGTQAVNSRLRIRGVAINGPKRVRITQGVEHEFAAQKIDEWILGPLQVPPGSNIFVMQDVLSPLSQTPLLVENIEILPAN